MTDKSKLQEILNYYENRDNHEKHLKGYIYDSLIFRYQLARYAQADYEAKAKGESIIKQRELATRDIMRFIQILDEGLGEHD